MEQSSTASYSKQIIDRIIYLASLVSEPRSVDESLNKLRRITASRVDPTHEDTKTLQAIEGELKDYLIHKERLRSFTDERLQLNIQRHFATQDPVHETKKIALKQIFMTVGAAALITALAVALGMRGQVILAFFVFALFTGIALLFQSVKKDLVKQLHGAVSYLMVATIGTGLFALNFPIIAASSYLVRLPLLQHGGFLVGAVPVYVFYYVAFYLYAKQLMVSIPRYLRPMGAAITAIIVTVISVLLPHPTPVVHEIYFDIAVSGFAVSVYLSSAAAILGFMAVPKTTTQYNRAILFLAVSMVLQTIGNAIFLVFVTFPSGTFSVNDEKGQIYSALMIVIALAVQYVSAYKIKTSLR